MFAPFGGPGLKLSFFETYLSCVSGAFLAAVIFYFSSEFFLKKAHQKRVSNHLKAIETGIQLKPKRKFTRFNKFIVRLKKRFGIYGISLFAPFILSVPLGSIVSAKFYGKEKKTFPLILIGIAFTGLITTGLAYFAKSLF
jgi:hypothetical protein